MYRNHLWLSSSAAALYFNYEEISVLYCVSLYKIIFGIDTIEIFVSYLEKLRLMGLLCDLLFIGEERARKYYLH